MANELDAAVFSAKEFKLDLTVSGVAKTDFGFKTATIPGIGDATTEEIKLNNDARTVITAVGTANNFQFTTVLTSSWFDWREAAQDMATYVAKFTGLTDSAFEGDVITISGKLMGIDDISIGTDGAPEVTFRGQTDYFNYQSN